VPFWYLILTMYSLAYHEMRLVLASVLLSFDLELCEEVGDWPNQDTYILWVKGPLMVRLKAAGYA
jgi:cytochrome P450